MLNLDDEDLIFLPKNVKINGSKFTCFTMDINLAIEYIYTCLIELC